MTTSDDLLDESNDALERGDIETAVELLERAAALGSRDAVFNLGNVEFDRGRYERAATLHRRALAEGEDDALMNLATDLLLLGRWAEARDHFVQAVEGLGDLRGLLGLAKSLEELGDRPGAIVALRRAVDADLDESVWLLAAVLARHGEVAEAHGLWERAVRDDPEALVSRGVFFRDQGDLERAKEDFFAALERGATSAHLYLASTYRKQRLVDRAEEQYRFAIDRYDASEGWHDLGSMYDELGRIDEADAAYARAEEFGSDCAAEHRRDLRDSES